MSKANMVVMRPDPAEVFDTIARVARPMAATVDAYHEASAAGHVQGDVIYLAECGLEEMRKLYDYGCFVGNGSLEDRVVEARCAFAAAHALAFMLKYYEEISGILPGLPLPFDEYDNSFYSAASALGYKYKPELRGEWIKKHDAPDR